MGRIRLLSAAGIAGILESEDRRNRRLEEFMFRQACMTRIAAVAVILLACQTAGARDATSGSADQPVEIEAEPLHSIKLVNPVVRVYEAVIPPEARTLFHTHRHSGVGIDMTTTRLYIDKIGATPNDEPTKAGDVFPVNAATPYVHQVVNVGEVAYRVVVAELLRPPRVSPVASTVADIPTYKLELENEQVRVFRLVLQPGETTPLHVLSASSLNVAVSGGQISIAVSGAAPRFSSLAPGALEWHADPVSLSVRNIGVSTYESVYFEWKPAAP
jgi:hypothetical protein